MAHFFLGGRPKPTLPPASLRCFNAQMIRPDIVKTCSNGGSTALTGLKFGFRPADEAGPQLSMVIVAFDPDETETTVAANRIDKVINNTFDFFRVSSLSDLSGRPVRLFSDYKNNVWSIGDYLKDDWFYPGASTTFNSVARRCAGFIRLGARIGGFPKEMTDINGTLHSLCVDTPPYLNARFAKATIVTGTSGLAVLLKFSVFSKLGQDEWSFRFQTGTMEQLNELVALLNAIGGVSEFERLEGRLARLWPESYAIPQVPGTSNLRIGHPFLDKSFEIGQFGGVQLKNDKQERAESCQ